MLLPTQVIQLPVPLLPLQLPLQLPGLPPVLLLLLLLLLRRVASTHQAVCYCPPR
jgi:hypothetical protein